MTEVLDVRHCQAMAKGAKQDFGAHWPATALRSHESCRQRSSLPPWQVSCAEGHLAAECTPSVPTEEQRVRISARNTLPGMVRKVERGAVNAEVTLELAPGLFVVSVITLDAVDNLRLKPGDRAYAVIKASSVMIGVD